MFAAYACGRRPTIDPLRAGRVALVPVRPKSFKVEHDSGFGRRRRELGKDPHGVVGRRPA
jgi:hypothetical protein